MRRNRPGRRSRGPALVALAGDECGGLWEGTWRRPRENGTTPWTAATTTLLNDNSEPALPGRRRGIVSLAWTGRPSNEDCRTEEEENRHKEFAALLLDGSVQLWRRRFSNNEEYDQGGSFQQVEEVSQVFTTSSPSQDREPMLPPSTHPLGLQSFGQADSSSSSLLCAGNAQGTMALLKTGESLPLQVVRRFETVSPKNQHGHQNYSAPPLLSCLAVHGRDRVAVGGRDRDVAIYNVESPDAPVFQAKNVAPDPQTQLAAPVWPTSILFASSSMDCSSNNNNNMMVVGTAQGHLRIYDVRQQESVAHHQGFRRRPVFFTDGAKHCSKKEVDDQYRITSLCCENNTLLVGDAGGQLHTLDWRHLTAYLSSSTSNKHRHRFPASLFPSLAKIRKIYQNHDDGSETAVPSLPATAAGSIRGLATSSGGTSDPPLVASVGLDRLLRLYELGGTSQRSSPDPAEATTALTLQGAVYLKQRLNCVLLGTAPAEEEDSEQEEDQDIVQDYVESDASSSQDDDSQDSDNGGGRNQQFASENSTSSEDEEDDDQNKKDDDGSDLESSSSGDEGSSDSDGEPAELTPAPRRKRHRRR